MSTDDLVMDLGLMQLSDSFFPTGLFAASNGLESLFVNEKITTPSELIEFNRVCIQQQVGPLDCVVAANACDFAARSDYEKITELDSVCSAIRTVKETREASFRSGIQLARCVKEFQESGPLSWYCGEIRNSNVTGVYPVSFGLCCNAMGIKRQRASLMLLYGFVVSNVGAALRLGMIQHFEGQEIIHALKPLMAGVAEESSGRTVQEIWQFSPQIEINQMSHEGMDSKMFIT